MCCLKSPMFFALFSSLLLIDQAWASEKGDDKPSDLTKGESEELHASIGLQFTFANYARGSTQQKQDGRESTTQVESLETANLAEGQIIANLGRFNVYFYPFQDNTAFFSLGYLFLDNLEFGLDLGLNTLRQKQSDNSASSSSRIAGAFMLYTNNDTPIPIELNLILDSTQIRPAPTATEESPATTQGTFAKASVTGLLPLAKNAWYLFGLGYSRETSKQGADSILAKEIGLQLAGFRVVM